MESEKKIICWFCQDKVTDESQIVKQKFSNKFWSVYKTCHIALKRVSGIRSAINVVQIIRKENDYAIR